MVFVMLATLRTDLLICENLYFTRPNTAGSIEDLYSSVPCVAHEMDTIVAEIDINLDTFDKYCEVSFSDVVDVIACLKMGKMGTNGVYDGLSTNHVIQGCDELFVHISMLFSAMLVHGVPTKDLLVSSIIPNPKGKGSARVLILVITMV